jgi:hypothetical protein
MTKQEWEELTLDEAIDWADREYGVYECTSEDSLIRFAKEKIDEDNIGLALHILSAIYNSEEAHDGYYLYDYSAGTTSTPTPITCKENLEDYVTFEEEVSKTDKVYIVQGTGNWDGTFGYTKVFKSREDGLEFFEDCWTDQLEMYQENYEDNSNLCIEELEIGTKISREIYLDGFYDTNHFVLTFEEHEVN